MIIAVLTQSHNVIESMQSYLATYWKFQTVSEIDFIPYLGLGRVVNDVDSKLRLLLALENIYGNLFVYGNTLLDKKTCAGLIENRHMVILISDENLKYEFDYTYYNKVDTKKVQSQFIHNRRMGLSGIYLWDYEKLLNHFRAFKSQAFEKVCPGFLQSIKDRGEITVSSTSDAIFQAMKELGLDSDTPAKSIEDLPMEPAKPIEIPESTQEVQEAVETVPEDEEVLDEPEVNTDDVLEVVEDTPSTISEPSEGVIEEPQESQPEVQLTSETVPYIAYPEEEDEQLEEDDYEDEQSEEIPLSAPEVIPVVGTTKCDDNSSNRSIKMKIRDDLLIVQANDVLMQFPLINFNEDEWITLTLPKPAQSQQTKVVPVQKPVSIPSGAHIKNPSSKVYHKSSNVEKVSPPLPIDETWSVDDIRAYGLASSSIEELEKMKAYTKSKETIARKAGDADETRKWHKVHSSIRNRMGRLLEKL